MVKYYRKFVVHTIGTLKLKTMSKLNWHTSKKLGLILTAEANSTVCPKFKVTQFSKDGPSRSIGILPQKHFPSSSDKMHHIDNSK